MEAILAPVLTAMLLLRCIVPLLTFRREPEIWAWLNLATGEQVPITHWENVIGRSKSCDVTIDFPTVSRNHAVLTRYDDGSWTITDVGSKEGTLVNGRKIQICALTSKERISIGGVEMQLQPITQRQEERQAQLRTKAASGWDTVTNLMLLTILQCAMLVGFLMKSQQTDLMSIVQGFGGIILGVIVVLGSGIPLILADRYLLKRPGYAGAALATAAGNAVATPAAIAAVDPALEPLVSAATTQVAAAVLVSALLTPVLTAWVVKHYGDARGVRKLGQPENHK